MINPYNFVRSEKQTTREGPNGHDRMQGRSGAIHCQLQVVTPIFTPAVTIRVAGSPADLRFFRMNNRPALPGSSLKGMLRNLAESICNGCSPFDNRIHPTCRSIKELCPACRIFGYLKSQNVHAGHISISDAIGQDGYEFGERVWLKELSSPKPQRHKPFYESAAQERGRKFYYHQQHIQDEADIPAEGKPTHRNVRIEPLVRGAFDFTVRYWNIEALDLGLLLHALELPQEMYHKFGMAKPLGLGTVRIDIIGWREDDPDTNNPASRYHSFDAQTIDISLRGLESEALIGAQQRMRDRINPLKHDYARHYSRSLSKPILDDLWAIPAKNIEDLRVMLSRVAYSNEIRYPDYSWFKRHSREKLPTLQEVERGKRLP
jgi:CRISPR/Cas system CSM-associated protein Csm3 (group 7 of RAMP superfamily)